MTHRILRSSNIEPRLGLVGSVACGRVVDLGAPLAALVGPWEMGDRNDEEAVDISLACMYDH
jgi:hypothetical protein